VAERLQEQTVQPVAERLQEQTAVKAQEHQAVQLLPLSA
jgi:hypothetical protein